MEITDLVVQDSESVESYSLSKSDLFMIDLPKDNIPLVLIGDVLDCLKQIPNESISVAVTSPPYWGHRDYYIKGQIGQESTSEKYIEKLLIAFRELLKKLTPRGAFFLNIGDTYIDKGLQMIPQRLATAMIQDKPVYLKRNKPIRWLLRNQIIWYKPNHMPSPAKTRFTNTYEPIYFFTRNDWEREVYFDLDAIRIPYKTQDEENNKFDLPLEVSEEDFPKIQKKIEGIQKEYSYNGKFEGNEENIGASPGGRLSVTGIKYIKKRKKEPRQEEICDYLRKWRDKAKISSKEIDRILGYSDTAGHWFRKDAGGSLPLPEDWIKLKDILKFDDKYDKVMTEIHYVLQTIRKHPKGKNPGDMWDWKNMSETDKKEWEKWQMETAKLSDKHFAVFPLELPYKAIQACCPTDGIVLDPFAGSGTTGKVAKDLGRKSILIELQAKFLNIIKKRCNSVKEIYIK